MSRFVEDLTGRKYARLTVIRRAGLRHRTVTWLCKCSCGNTCEVTGHNLRKGLTRSCGCLRREVSAANRRRSGAAAYLSAKRFEEAFADKPVEIAREEKTWSKAEDAARMLAGLW